MAIDAVRMRNDLSESWLSLRFEMLKHLKRRRLFIVGALAIVVPLFFYVYFYQADPNAAVDFANMSLQFMNVLIVISAAMFAGDAVCGEFEKKTSLLIFPTPQRRSSIFVGKYAAAVMATFLVVSLYYVVLTLQIGQLFGWGEIPGALGKSFLTALIYSVAAVSVAFLISSLLKRSMSATIVSFLALLMILPIVQMLISVLDQEPWFIVTYSSGLITSVLGASSSLPMNPGGGTSGNEIQQFTPTLKTGIAVMVTWAIACLAAGMAIAVKKED
ncbi:MAG: ABC transporter permease [Dehalococcoidia bacterium]|nr:ABC transporter permease [Dehalococcoidia bacterium]